MAAVAAARTAQAPKRLASGPVPPAPGSPACGRESLRGQLARALGLQLAHHAEDVPAGSR
jgi:hypothetical protein